MTLNPRAELAQKITELQRRLPLTGEQSKQFDELLPLAHKVCTNLLKRWSRHRWLMRDDLRQQAAIHLADAIRDFDPSRSPCIRGWTARYVRWRLQDWLKAEYRERDYKTFTRWPELDCFLAPHDRPAGSVAPRDVRLCDDDAARHLTYEDRRGWYHDERPIHYAIAKETAEAVRHCFDPRNVEIFCEKWQGHSTADIAAKHYIKKSRIYEIAAEIREYIMKRLEGTRAKCGWVAGELINSCLKNSNEARERALKLFS